MEESSKRVVVIGGGTGTSTILNGLKTTIGDGLTAVISVADDGGSTGVLRKEYDILPPGDLRQCLVALSNRPAAWKQLFGYRFGGGVSGTSGLKGHTLGNLVLTAAEDLQAHDMVRAVSLCGEMLDITGQVVPATTDKRTLSITLPAGQQIIGEHQADMSEIPSFKGAEVAFDQPAAICDEADRAMNSADLVIIAPGDLYSSVAPVLAIEGMAKSLQSVHGVLVLNLMNRSSQTSGFSALDYVQELERIAGCRFVRDIVYNTELPAGDEHYQPVVVDAEALEAAGYRLWPRALVSKQMVTLDPNDAIASTRSLIRHDPVAVAAVIDEILAGAADA